MERLAFPLELKLSQPSSDTGAIEGYASVFGVRDQVGDIVEPGAFKETIAELGRRNAGLPMLWQHQSDQPIGVWSSVSEDRHGLKVAGELILDVPQARAARSLIKAGALRGISIGYRVRPDGSEIDRSSGARRLKSIELWEASLVTFPALPEAQVTAVKDASAVHTARAFEDFLHASGFSRAAAKTLTAGGWAAFKAAPAPAPDRLAALLQTINSAAAELKGS